MGTSYVGTFMNGSNIDYSAFFLISVLNHVFQLGSTADPCCLLVAPMFWGLVAIGRAVSIFVGILLLGRSSKLNRGQMFIKSVFTHLDLIGVGQLWLGGPIHSSDHHFDHTHVQVQHLIQ